MSSALVNAILAPLYTEYTASQNGAPVFESIRDYPLAARRKLVDQLLTIRQPVRGPLPPDVDEAIDALLREEGEGMEWVDAERLPTHTVREVKLSFVRGDLTLLSGELAIVNPANKAMLGCFQPTHKCLDNIIHARAGPSVRRECYEAMRKRRRHELATGEPLLTRAGVLPVRGIVHVAGPALELSTRPTRRQEEELRATYLNTVDLVAENGFKAVAFPCISTGVFAFPVPLAAQIALRAAADWATHGRPLHIIFVLWTPADEAAYAAAAASVFPSLPRPLPIFRQVVPACVRRWIAEARSVIVHAGAGMSADAVNPSVGVGLDYTSTELFSRLHPQLAATTSLRCLYDTIGYPFKDDQQQWGFFFAHAHTVLHWGKTGVYERLLSLLADRPYAVMTSNVDTQFVQNGFDASRVYTPQGSYATFQCAKPCAPDAFFDGRPYVERVAKAYDLTLGRVPDALVDLIPKCPKCGGGAMLNVRGGAWFLDAPYLDARKAYEAQVSDMLADARAHGGIVLVLEIGAGFNTPGVVRVPSERLVEANRDVVRLVRVNPQAPELHGPLGEEGVGLRVGAGEFFEALT